MAEADIAYVATAGAAGLAMAVSAWALLLRGRLKAAADAAERERTEALDSLGRHDAMLRAFDDVSLALPPDGRGAGAPIGSAELVARLAEEGDDVGAAVLAHLRQSHGALVDALVDQGQAFEGLTALDSVEPWRIEGRVAGGVAWLRLSPASRITLTGADATESGLAMLGDASPTPTWVVDGAGKLAWANRAWLTAINAESLDAAIESGLSFDRGADALVAEAARLGVRQEGFRWTTGGGAAIERQSALDGGRRDPRHPAPPRRGA
jgi:PAS domain-containing protein